MTLVAIKKGKLVALPTRKGDDIFVGDTHLSHLLAPFYGKNIEITISEISESLTNQAWETVSVTISESNAEPGVRRYSTRKEKNEEM